MTDEGEEPPPIQAGSIQWKKALRRTHIRAKREYFEQF